MTRLASRPFRFLAAFLISRHAIWESWEEATTRAVKAEQERDVYRNLANARGTQLLRAKTSIEEAMSTVTLKDRDLRACLAQLDEAEAARVAAEVVAFGRVVEP